MILFKDGKPTQRTQFGKQMKENYEQSNVGYVNHKLHIPWMAIMTPENEQYPSPLNEPNIYKIQNL